MAQTNGNQLGIERTGMVNGVHSIWTLVLVKKKKRVHCTRL